MSPNISSAIFFVDSVRLSVATVGGVLVPGGEINLGVRKSSTGSLLVVSASDLTSADRVLIIAIRICRERVYGRVVIVAPETQDASGRQADECPIVNYVDSGSARKN